jgi:hypothetical protein
MIKIEIDGTGEEVRSEMLKLLGLPQTTAAPVSERQIVKTEFQLEEEEVRSTRRRRKRAPLQPESWAAEDVERLLSEVNPNSTNILTELAKRPEGYPRSELIQVLNLKERAVGGQLSSLGSALRRMGRAITPVTHEKIDNDLVYRLNKEFAALMNQRNS